MSRSKDTPTGQSRRQRLCWVKFTMAFAVVIITVDALALATADSPGAFGFGLANLFAVMINPTWGRRPTGRCWVTTVGVVMILAASIAVVVRVPVATGNPSGLLGVAAVLLACLPATARLAPRQPRIWQ